MFLLSFIVVFGAILSLVLMTLSLYLVKKKIMNREKMTPFECGFDPKSSARVPFSLRFFLVTVIFLVFDVEIVLLLPYVVSSGGVTDVYSLLGSVSVIMILVGGTLHEWREGSLMWFG
uniref:NADH-ubiquinone oxidoreductase chain 3 n=1 Tax=Nuttallochiton mirandus TaxID=256062 RepID=A0A6H1PG20_NULMI|nr:NADH dehydrogenase subunit 3 [Nuttallochiton mirandus]